MSQHSPSRLCVSLAIGWLGGCSPNAGTPGQPAADLNVPSLATEISCPPAPVDPYADPTPTRIAMRDVELVMPEGLLRVRYLDGTVKGPIPGQPPAIDDPKGYSIAVDSAEVAVDIHTLNRMMSAADSPGGRKAPLASAVFTIEDGRLVVTGAKPVPFVLKGSMSVDPKGRLTLTVMDLKALGIQTKGILKALDLKLEDLVDVTNERGVRIDDNVVHIDPLVNMAAPFVEAKITGVSVEADGLVLKLGDVGTTKPETPTAQSVYGTAITPGTVTNYVSYSGGTVIQGKLTIRNTQLKILDLDPTDPLRLSTDDIGKQVAAGYTKISESGAMSSFVPDANQVSEGEHSP